MLQKYQVHNCNYSKLITDTFNGEIFCSNCGTVIEEKLDNHNETPVHSLEDFMSKSQVGSKQSLSIHDKGMSSIIGKDKDATGKSLSSFNKSRFNRLRVLDSRSKTRKSSARTLVKSLTFLNGLKGKLGISENTIESTSALFRRAQKHQLIRGRSSNDLMAAALYVSCRQTMTPRSLEDISETANITKKHLQKSVRVLINEFELVLPQYNISSFLTKLSNDLGFSEKTKRYALNILSDVEKCGSAAGKNPIGQAAASLYLASMLMGENISQKIFSKISGVSTVTLRNRKNTIQKLLEL
ncbi:transcription factor TFIIB [Candidatus Nitrosopumilus sp. SW]|uniref:transcription initiation factor IIB n=1 Tax=Candidatus Nitrosopumilus sp. SW TaxID=2508726 RepID=UPI00114F5490|nr:transcription factor TFIIB [Candidatus Nitrosopumilus sp. SW]QDI88289.1 transcription factor TFIIB [Candidatus Nitrosopumilus sp. SW]